jgi:hypothetical protein
MTITIMTVNDKYEWCGKLLVMIFHNMTIFNAEVSWISDANFEIKFKEYSI